MKQITHMDEGPPWLYECSNGHKFDVDPTDYTNTIPVNVEGRHAQVEKCPECGEEGDKDRYKAKLPTTNKKFVVRRNCEYSVLVTADDESMAIDLASRIPHHDWSPAWSGMEAEEET